MSNMLIKAVMAVIMRVTIIMMVVCVMRVFMIMRSTNHVIILRIRDWSEFSVVMMNYSFTMSYAFLERTH